MSDMGWHDITDDMRPPERQTPNMYDVHSSCEELELFKKHNISPAFRDWD